MPYRRTLAAAIAALLIGLTLFFCGPWEKIPGMLGRPKPPTPYHFESLKGWSDEAITDFMSGKLENNSFQPADAPDSHFPKSLWGTDPKTAALAFADANRTPGHRKLFQLTMDGNPAIKAPEFGWIVFDNFSSQTVLHFGNGDPVLLRAKKNYSRFPDNNHFTDHSSHSLQLISLTPAEARFLAHTVFWLGHIKSHCNRKDHHESLTSSTGDRFGKLAWFVDKQAPRNIEETLWSHSSIADRWSADYDDEASLNLTKHLLAEALPKQLGKRWVSNPPLPYTRFSLPLTERLKPHVDEAAREQLSDVILAAMARHDADPWPAAALIALAECAGDAGLTRTLPALEKLAARLPPTGPDEAELGSLKDKFRFEYQEPGDPVGKKQWDRYKILQDQLEHDFQAQLRPPLAQAIRQLQAVDQPTKLIDLAKSDDPIAIWALQQLYPGQPDAHAEALTAQFHKGNQRERTLAFETLAAVHPPAARRLRDTLTEQEAADLMLEITWFEITDSPASAQARIPTLLEIVANPDNRRGENKRGFTIDLLAKLPLDQTQQVQFERLLLSEVLSTSREPNTIRHAVAAMVNLPEPDRYWDALFEVASTTPYPSDFDSLLDGLAALAMAKPEPRRTQLTELLRSRFNRHQGAINDLCMMALAFDLRPLAPEIARFATSGPEIPDGEYSPNQRGDLDHPCLHRYHSARHVTALWLEPDADTRARMWTALLLESSYKFIGMKTIASGLRDRCHAALMSASPELRNRLVAQARSNPTLAGELSDWLTTLLQTP